MMTLEQETSLIKALCDFEFAACRYSEAEADVEGSFEDANEDEYVEHLAQQLKALDFARDEVLNLVDFFLEEANPPKPMKAVHRKVIKPRKALVKKGKKR
jgi:hypothetical protein